MALESDYQAHRGEVNVRESFMTDLRSGESYLDYLNIVVRLRVTHEQALILRKKYPGTQLRTEYIEKIGPIGVPQAEIEINLRIDDALIEPYLRWRDGILAKVYEASYDT